MIMISDNNWNSRAMDATPAWMHYDNFDSLIPQEQKPLFARLVSLLKR